MKKLILALMMIFAVSLFAVGCNSNETTTEPVETEKTEDANKEEPAGEMTGEISVVSREAGSGTRGAFVELTGVEVDKEDKTYAEASIQNGTDGVMTTVAGNPSAIGYISLGSVNDTIKPLKVDGVEATDANIKAGEYKISRPFLVTYKEADLSDLAKDFLTFIESKEGQKVVGDHYIIAHDDAPAYEKKEGLSGTIQTGGSTSVSPLMEKLAEAYKALNPDVIVEIESTGSGAGITGSIEGILEIGMSSRELKDEEKSKIDSKVIALDGIAVIVNKENAMDDISLENIGKVFRGELTEWSEVK